LFLIDPSQNLLQALNKVVLVNQLHPSELLFTVEKKSKSLKANSSGWGGPLWHAAQTIFFEPIC
jgi:hypothetical protein